MPSDPKVDEDGYTLAETVEGGGYSGRGYTFVAFDELRNAKMLRRAMFGAPPSPIHRDYQPCDCSACRCGFPLQCIHGAR